MALSDNNADRYVTVSSATQSDHIKLVPGREYVLEFTSAGAFALDVQTSGDGSNFKDLYDTSGKITIDTTAAAAMHVRVPGGLCYRMDVDTYNNPITMTAYEVLS